LVRAAAAPADGGVVVDDRPADGAALAGADVRQAGGAFLRVRVEALIKVRPHHQSFLDLRAPPHFGTDADDGLPDLRTGQRTAFRNQRLHDMTVPNVGVGQEAGVRVNRRLRDVEVK